VVTALAGLFALRQRACAAPLIDLRLFRNRLFSWGTAAFAVISFAMTGALFILTPYLQSVQGNDAQGTGLRLLPMIGALITAAAASEMLAARIGVRFVIPAGMALSAAGLPSGGCKLALEATRRPELRKIYDTAGATFRDPARGLMAALGSTDPERHSRSFIAWSEGLMFDSVAGAGNRAAPTREEIRAGVLDQPVHADLAQLAVIQNHDTAGRLGGISVPALVLAGEEDILIPVSLSRGIHEAIPGSEWATTKGGHACLWEHPAEFNQTFLDFVRRHANG
jgi:pimeloyl-ACP methyl ester carboxylesterase